MVTQFTVVTIVFIYITVVTIIVIQVTAVTIVVNTNNSYNNNC